MSELSFKTLFQSRTVTFLSADRRANLLFDGKGAYLLF